MIFAQQSRSDHECTLKAANFLQERERALSFAYGQNNFLINQEERTKFKIPGINKNNSKLKFEGKNNNNELIIY